MLDFVEETFDQMTLLVQMVIVFSLFFSVLARWDHRFGFFLRNRLKNSSASYERSAMTRSKSNAAIKSSAWVMSWRCPPVSRKRSGLPKASTQAWILVLNPPRLRPRAWFSCPPLFLKHLRRKDALAQWYCRARFAPYPDHWRNVDAYRPHLVLTPTRKAFVDRIPVPLLFRKHAPLCAAAQDPQNSLHELPTFCFLSCIRSGVLL
jgi:hypothetical protein